MQSSNTAVEPSPNQSAFTRIALLLAKASTPEQLQEAVTQMDSVKAGECVSEEEALALLTICRDRHHSMGILGSYVL